MLQGQDFALNDGISKNLGRGRAFFSPGNDESNVLYSFNAESHPVGTIPVELVSEDASDAYEIIDSGGILGKGLRKKSGNTATKWCFFNSYLTFAVPVKAKFYFFMTSVSAFQSAFSLNLVNTANTGGYVLGFQRDAATGNAKHNGWTANTNAGFVSSNGALDIDGANGYNYQIPVATNIGYVAELRTGANGKPRMRISLDGGANRMNTVEYNGVRGQNRVGWLDGVGQSGNIHLKKVEVIKI